MHYDFTAILPVAFQCPLDWLTVCLFVAAPDVVADAEATLDLFGGWRREIASQGLPVALVAQDGLESLKYRTRSRCLWLPRTARSRFCATASFGPL